MICIYCVYLLMMSKNDQLRLFCARKINFFDKEREKILAEYADLNKKSGYSKKVLDSIKSMKQKKLNLISKKLNFLMMNQHQIL
jgi:hypothetical protein